MQQARDFRDESDQLHALIEPLSDGQMATATAFKGWTINNVIAHLHTWNHGADLSLSDPEKFREFFERLVAHRDAGGLVIDFEKAFCEGAEGRDLVRMWRDYYGPMSERFAQADPSARVPWAGPSMSVRSSVSARLMETWAHGQEVFDVLGVVRRNADRIRNIVILGVNTYGWTFHVRGETPPEPMPHLRLTAPSGEIWEYGDPSSAELIEGLAEEFCQVVTQVRNIADTSLKVTGPNATEWMAKAQCFAGAPNDPPAPGARRTAVKAA